jgi:hypothetical protein
MVSTFLFNKIVMSEKKRGRPFSENPKGEFVGVRMTTDELKRWLEKAQGRPLSEVIREVMNRWSRR